MSADPIVYCLDQLSDYREFERLCSTLLAGVGYPDLDPLGGTGDEGRDAIIRSDESGHKIVFAYTVRADWKVKLASDSKRVYEMNHAPDTFVFVCTQALTATDKDYAHQFIADKYGWELDLFDLERLRVQLVGPQRHLIEQHPSIFSPLFFPRSGGLSVAESRDLLLIDHVPADHAAAAWLARRLSLEGYRTWCLGTAPLAGENADASVRQLLDLRVRHYLPFLSAASLSNGIFVERVTIAASRENFVLPCVAAVFNDPVPSRLKTLTPAAFNESWKVGLADVLARLGSIGINPSLDSGRGQQIALRDYLPVNVTVDKPEPVYANVFPLQLPNSLFLFNLQKTLKEEDARALRQRWAFVEASEYRLVAFTPPPDTDNAIVMKNREVSWRDTSVFGKSNVDLVKELAWRSLQVVCAQKGLQFCQDRKVFYFPRRDGKEWKQTITHVDGRSTTVNLTGERTQGRGERTSSFFYQLAPLFSPQFDAEGNCQMVLRIYVRVTTPEGRVFEGKEIARRRKAVTKSWWNQHWLARLLGVAQAIETSAGRIEIGEDKHVVTLATQPLSWKCPFGLDTQALSELPDIGEEIAQFRALEEENEEAFS